MSLTPEPHQDLLRGKWGSFPFRPSNLLRIFVSSAPSDMAAERDALMDAAYPAVQAFCQKQGLMLEVIDLRWGIHDDTGAVHAATPLFLEEIKRCQKLSVGPSFVALLGSHYGNCPAPLAIGEQEFEALLAQLQEEPQILQLLARWYLKDENATPAVYVLQHSPCQASPGGLGEGLVLALRRAAWEAEKQSLLGREQRLQYHKSDAHWEIETGLLSSGERDGQGAAVVFFREVEAPEAPSLDGAGEEEGSSVPGGEDQQMLEDLKTSIASTYPAQVKVQRVPRNVDPSRLRHKPQPKYLKELCDQFVAVTNYQTLRSLRAHEGSLGEWPGLFQELGHHLALAQERSQAFCWRKGLIDHICQHMSEKHHQVHAPLLVHGPPGCGKTALLCYLGEAVRDALGPEAVVVVRLLGTSQASSSCSSLLRSVCLQVCLAMGLPLLGAGDPILLFHSLLCSASHQGTQPLVLLLDSAEQLCTPADPSAASWMPVACPPRVHLVISMQEGKGGTLLHKVARAPGDDFEMAPLSQEQAREALARDLASAGRTLQPPQQAVLCQSFSEGEWHALSVAQTIRKARQWASYTLISALEVSLTALEAAHHLCGRLEEVHGSVLVAHVLGYLACARYGLSEAEMKDVLSLDNEVLSEIYQRHPPPSKGVLRLPPLLWAQLYRDLAWWLEDRWADNLLLMGFLHREFSAVVEDRYLSVPEERVKRHLLLADFFRGTWSRGIKKPLLLPSSSKPVSFDRKVTPQPLWFSSKLANQRKLSELPFHLLQAGRTEELQQDILGNMTWIACRAVAPGVWSLAADFAMCLARIRCPELRLLHDALLLLEPLMDGAEGRIEASVIYPEMLARLHPLVPSYSGGLIGSLCQQCESWLNAQPHPVLIPLCGFLYPPDGPLRKTVAGFPRGTSVLEVSVDQRLLLAGSQDGPMIVWDMENFTVRHVLMGHSAEVRCVRVFRKGTRAASVALDHTLRLWSLDSGREELSIPAVPAGDQEWSQLNVSEKQQMVYWASGSEVCAWHLETAAPIFQISVEPLGGWLCAAVFVPRLAVVTVSASGGLCLWDSVNGQLLSKQELLGLGEESPACSVLLQKLGRMVAGFSGGSLLMVSSDGKSLLEKLPEGICFLVLSKDESLLTTGFGRRVRVFQPNLTGFHRLLSSDLLHDREVCTAAISADNSTIFTSAQDECIWVWRLSKQGWLMDALGDIGMPATHLALSGTLLVSASRHSPYLRVWDLGYNRERKPLPPCMASTRCLGLSHDAKYVFFPQVNSSCHVVIWDSEEGEERSVLDVSAPVQCLEVAEQRNLLFVGLVSGTVLVFPLDSQQDVGCIPPAENQKPVTSLALTQNEDQVAVACVDLVQVLDVGQGEPGLLIDRPAYTFYTQIPGAAISSVALLAEYRVLYGMTNGELFLYHCPQGQVFPLEVSGGGSNGSITCLRTSHREKWALSGSADSLRCLWDMELCSWEHQMFFQKRDSFSQGVFCACFSEDDQYLFTGSLDQCVTVWDVSCGALLAVQFVYARITRMMSTTDGFVAATRLGYLIREKFHCPPSVNPHYNPLRYIKATCRVKSRKRDGEYPSGQPSHQGNALQAGQSHHDHKVSQICRIV